MQSYQRGMPGRKRKQTFITKDAMQEAMKYYAKVKKQRNGNIESLSSFITNIINHRNKVLRERALENSKIHITSITSQLQSDIANINQIHKRHKSKSSSWQRFFQDAIKGVPPSNILNTIRKR